MNLARYLQVSVCAVLAMLLTGPGTAHAEPAPPVPPSTDGAVTVSGDVGQSVTFTPEDIRALPSTAVTTTFQTPSGPQTHTYTGAPLEALLTTAKPIPGTSAQHPFLTVAILASGADGYAAALSWAEVSSALRPDPALVAWDEDGVPLARPRLVVPADVKGARYVRDLTSLRVVQLAAP
ncbi:molybdopterin-dependent oxidoreductase [Mycolicibacterium sp.]|uniref:molybdopterin-dependent oxidoreductase n=1 Tax=Mycolicibacterium sp. TaxID=2320850 RepID=UPI003D1091B0